jgi:ethanolamine ammonia-lyase small subunit
MKGEVRYVSRDWLAHPDAWQRLRQWTPARIALGRAGASLPTAELLDFQLAHARARDAVHAPFDAAALARDIEQLGLKTVCLASAAGDRETFLKQPDLGRRLDETSRALLREIARGPSVGADDRAGDAAERAADLAIVVSDGLSALAIHRQVAPLLAAWLPLWRAAGRSVATVVLVERGRVAIEDEVGQLLAARVAVILIGERPGLGSPDSLGAYLVYEPRAGRTDAERNCVSNIRPQGLAPEAAALKLDYLVREALARRLSGVRLKDESAALERVESAASPGDSRALPGA